MELNDVILVSTDDHVIEPPDLFSANVPQRYRAQAPRVVTLANGEERWEFDGKLLATVGSAAVAGRSRDERHLEPSNFSDMRRGCWDPVARAQDMSVNGTLASVCFATLTGFAGELFLKGQDKDFMLALLQAYNDWNIDAWCAAAPGRFISVGMLPLWDPALAADEVRRLARKGVNAISFPENCAALGVPTFHKGHWDPVFDAITEADLAMVIHIGTGGGFRTPSMDSACDVPMCTMNITLADCAADIVFSPVPMKYPKLRIALSEGYIGWMPFFKERCDYVYEMHRRWTGADFKGMKPSELIRRHFLLCFTEDEAGVKARHDIGVETLTWEADYPHADSTWPDSPERLWRSLKDLPDEEIHAITHRNALRFFRFDPFRHIAAKDATVGALRAAAGAVDTTPIRDNRGGRSTLDLGNRHLSVGDLAAIGRELNLGLVSHSSTADKQTGAAA
ncbi:MAG: amidohydrolase family protein [Gammaproteobacteria bacterium]